MFAVQIEKIDGLASIHGWSGPEGIAELLPGTYELELSADWMAGGLIVMALDAFNDNNPRAIRLTVEAGRDYEIDFDVEAGFYFISIFGHEEWEDLPPPPTGLARCSLTPTKLDRERCEGSLSE